MNDPSTHPNSEDPMHTNSQRPRPGVEPELEQADEALEALRRDLVQGYAALKRSLYIERRALGLALFDSAFHVVSVAAGVVVAVTLAITASVLTVIGLRRGVATWSQDAWWSDILLAGVLLAIVGLGAWSYRRWMHRSTLSDTRRRLAPPDNSASPSGGDGQPVSAS